ncbi:hypothetical protein D2T29_13630 [Sinirhodobacter populi]|uniref:Capsular biosynthesis protein n=1 Tax=Paenirhodobacter populi TaxID=2306993 RepID=A0A443KB10_9RHOB|nr:capsular polysaccharide synthesis protein [Sinirhodobacter populi]RWR29823.1 hypothetical protein D2T29_13630 [Sinirhodobacter populi]
MLRGKRHRNQGKGKGRYPARGPRKVIGSIGRTMACLRPEVETRLISLPHFDCGVNDFGLSSKQKQSETVPKQDHMTLRSALGRTKRRGIEFARWMTGEFPHAPGLEVYSRIINRHTGHLTRFLQQGGRGAFEEYIAPYQDRDIPRILWIYWRQGEAQAPHVVRLCIASWREMNPDWDVRILDDTTVAQYADISDVPAHLPPRFHANLLRLRLLAQYGGIWADATTLCHRPLNDWIPLMAGQTGFFVFGGPYLDRWIDNWFIAANPKSDLIQAWCRAYARYVTRLKREPRKYFMMIYTLQWCMLRDAKLRHDFRRSGSLPAISCFLLQAWLEGRAELGPFRAAYAAGLPLSKLNWRLPMTDAEVDRRLSEALSRTEVSGADLAASLRA